MDLYRIPSKQLNAFTREIARLSYTVKETSVILILQVEKERRLSDLPVVTQRGCCRDRNGTHVS